MLKKVVIWGNFQPDGVENRESYLKTHTILLFKISAKKLDFVAVFHFWYTVDVVYLTYQSNESSCLPFFQQ